MTGTFPSSGERRKQAPRWQRRGWLIVLLVAAGVLAAACGGGRSDYAASSSANRAADSSARQSGLLFADCMRSHGVADFPDPAPDGGFDIARGVKQEPNFQSASHACQGYLPGGGASAKHVNIQEEVTFAGCMRSHGITDFPDPLPGGGFDITFNTGSPQFGAAARACESTGIHWNGP